MIYTHNDDNEVNGEVILRGVGTQRYDMSCSPNASAQRQPDGMVWQSTPKSDS